MYYTLMKSDGWCLSMIINVQPNVTHLPTLG